MKRLGVNIDHIATLRNARGELHPDPIFAAKFVKKAGADSITIHIYTFSRSNVRNLYFSHILKFFTIFVCCYIAPLILWYK